MKNNALFFLLIMLTLACYHPIADIVNKVNEVITELGEDFVL